MSRVLLQEAIKLNKERKRRKLWGQFVRFLSCVVVFCTTYALILPAITLEKPTICGMEEHEHIETCFETKYETQLQCPYESGELTLHVHEGTCYVQEKVLVCTLPETKPHEHMESCSTEQKVLICTLGEMEGHAHSEACYPVSSELTCTLSESEAHLHDENCAAEDGTFTCTLEETDGHIHDEKCYTTVVSNEANCGVAECEEHYHDENCYELQTVTTCTMTEDVIHTHEESCYELQDKLSCELLTDHFHGEECYVEVVLEEESLICEIPIHLHEQSCYPPETEEEVMEDSLQAGFLCGLGIHTHKETCYDEEGILTCTISEHKHTAKCVVEDYDETADIETQEEWEATFADIELTENWPENVLAIAESQLDYKESSKNCVLCEDGEIRGYTRFGDWYGYPYGDWCAMFASFCMHYAGVENVPFEASVNEWISKLKETEKFLLTEEYLPKPGDLIFFDWEYEEGKEIDADHVGFVAEIIPATEDEPAQIKTLEGNASDAVKYVTYDKEDPVIIGYGELPIGPQLELENELETEKNLVYTDSTMRVDMVVTCEDGLPEDLSLQVITITEDNHPEAYGAMYVALGEQMYDSPYYVKAASFYQMELYSEGELYQLPENAEAKVNVSFVEPVFSPETVADAAKLQTFTLIEEKVEKDVVEENVEAVVEEEENKETVEKITEEVLKEEEPEEIVEETITEPVEEGIPEEESVEPDADATMLFSMKNTPVMAADAYEGEPEDFETEDTGSGDETLVLPEFQAVELQNDGYDNADNGITGLSFRSNNAMTFALAVASEPVEADYWKRVTSASELTTDGTYMIVSAEGYYALNGNPGNSATKVSVEMVKGNPGYYTINDNGDSSLRWRLSQSGSSYYIQNIGTSRYIYMSSTSLLSTSRRAITLTELSDESCWTFYGNRRYLTYSSSFSSTSSGDEYIRSMMIFKLINTSLEIPNDVVEGSGSSSSTVIPEKPMYSPYVEVSEEKTDTTMEGNVSGTYYSDPATSNLETLFDNNKEDDGKVLTDKSVIYGDDDYSAFENYDPNTFGVTLSALGQEYLISEQQEIGTPIDVVFVLDVSGSMKTMINGSSRADAMVNAVNTAITEIQKNNENNRVGVVVYSSGTMDVMDLGRYSQADGKYLKTQLLSSSNSDGKLNGAYRVLPNDRLYNEKGTLVTASSELTENLVQGNGTYTQAGIAKGAAMLERADNKVHTVVVNEGTETEQTFNIKRQPVMILLSDGEPSHCTSNYMDVLSGPHYADGLVIKESYQGIMGYYTILSANYYKRMIGIEYDMPALFYTVGMGISEKEDVALSGNDADSDVFKRAVLNPTKENIEKLSSSINPENTVNQLKALMLNEYTGSSITVTVGNQDYYMPTWLGQVHEKVPVLRNPYIDNYSYADEAFFGQLGENELDGIFSKILISSQKVNSYGFILQSRSSAELTDPIGEGMEVLGNPILRYGGKNYVHTSTATVGNKTTYVYNYQYTSTDGSRQYADLSNIKVEIVTDENGLQTISMIIPDHVLPAYSPYPFSDAEGNIPFYYEALPVRLIYQVGLTEEAKTEIADLEKKGGTLTYYTNRYENVLANATMKPTNDNPYYKVGNEHDHGKEKENNLTQTDLYSFECHHEKVNYGGEEVPLITQELGNNGKLVFQSEITTIDIPIKKNWSELVEAARRGTVKINLYKVIDTTATLIDSVDINSETNWKASFEDLDPLENGYYAIQEEYMEGFAAIYEGTTKNIVVDGKAITVIPVKSQTPGIAETVVITNTPAYKLPDTGGTGIQINKLGSMLIGTSVLIYGYTQMKKRRKNKFTGPP